MHWFHACLEALTVSGPTTDNRTVLVVYYLMHRTNCMSGSCPSSQLPRSDVCVVPFSRSKYGATSP